MGHPPVAHSSLLPGNGDISSVDTRKSFKILLAVGGGPSQQRDPAASANILKLPRLHQCVHTEYWGPIL